MVTIVHYALPDWLWPHTHQRPGEGGELFTHDHRGERSHREHEESWFVEVPPPAG